MSDLITTPADLVREMLATERVRVAEYGDRFMRCFDTLFENLCSELDDIDGSDAAAVRDGVWHECLGWRPAISFGGYAEGLGERLVAAVEAANRRKS